MINFERYRTSSMSIDLVKAYIAYVECEGDKPSDKAIEFLKNIQDIHPIESRQVATIAIATAMQL